MIRHRRTLQAASLRWLGALALLVGHASPVAAENYTSIGPLELTSSSDPVTLAARLSAAGDPGGRPFVIVDKLAARVLVFDAGGTLVAETPALLGVAQSDESPPGIGTMRLADITPELRVTAAGRYEAHLGANLAGKPILWVDYDTALSLHAVATGNAKERRLERLATPSVHDNRISYGCINVPAAFFEDVVLPLFGPANGVVYILPERTI